MLSIIHSLPDHVFGVKAQGEVNATDLKEVLLPGLERLTANYGEI
ncbi:MAG: STAS/SEC14 domain-containing protein, partial [Pedobacter sp.]